MNAKRHPYATFPTTREPRPRKGGVPVVVRQIPRERARVAGVGPSAFMDGGHRLPPSSSALPQLSPPSAQASRRKPRSPSGARAPGAARKRPDACLDTMLP